MKVASLITRNPIIKNINNTDNKFLKEYFNYNKLLSNSINLNFPINFYFQKGSLNEKKFRNYLSDKELSEWNYTSYKKDESITNLASETELSLRENTLSGEEDKNFKSIKRLPMNSISLLINKGNNKYQLPSIQVNDKHQSLYDASNQCNLQHFNNQLDLWLVSKLPIGYFNDEHNDKVFILMYYILNGQQSQQNNEYGWYSKHELNDFTNDQWKPLLPLN